MVSLRHNLPVVSLTIKWWILNMVIFSLAADKISASSISRDSISLVVNERE